MKRFENQKLNRKDHRGIEVMAKLARVILMPIFLPIRIYCWVCDYDYYERFTTK